MKRTVTLTVLVLCFLEANAQVGIGTLSPNTKSVLELNSNSKGLLLPRMTTSERTGMTLGAADAGMMVFQTNSPKGPYYWDGTTWIFSAPLDPGSATNTTLRWDLNASKWIGAGNLYNGGGTIGINTSSLNYQLHISGSSSATRMQLTGTNTGVTAFDGLLIGVSNPTPATSAGTAFLNQQETKPLWFGTSSLERMRIDSAGNVGINTTSPSARLDVNGNFKLGTNGTALTSVIRMDIIVDPPVISGQGEWPCTFTCPNTVLSSVVYVSAEANMDHVMIGNARVTEPGSIEIKFINVGSSATVDLSPVMLHVAVIQ